MLLGMSLAVSASIFWTFSPVFFAAAGRKIGPFRVNVNRLIMAGLMLCIIGLAYAPFASGGHPYSIPWRGGLYLVLSGLFGLVIGDMFYLEALTLIGPRRTTQFITLAPIIPVIVAWIILGERLSWNILLGIGIVIGGIAYIVFHEQAPLGEVSAEPGRFSTKGFFIALIAIAFHSMGAIMARWAFVEAPHLDPVIATVVRVASAAVIMVFVALARNDLAGSIRSLHTPGALSRLTGGVLTGPVIGMIFYVSAFKYAYAGVVSTLSSFSPVLILPLIAIRYRVKIRIETIIGAVVTVVGASIMGFGR
jgi:drug/metabolite transporter (DMT)-like permease